MIEEPVEDYPQGYQAEEDNAEVIEKVLDWRIGKKGGKFFLSNMTGMCWKMRYKLFFKYLRFF